jgi:hypothetical protein
VRPFARAGIEVFFTNLDPDTGRWISRAEVAEVPFAAFASRPQHDQV